MSDYRRLLQRLVTGGVEFILVGGVAAVLHGSARLTEDLDVVYRRSPDNLERIAEALREISPYLRGAPVGLPFRWDATTLERGMNFTLTTSEGALDLLGDIIGGGGYEALAPHAEKVEVFGVECLCLGLRRLIEVKRAAGRPKDLEALAELESLLADEADGG